MPNLWQFFAPFLSLRVMPSEGKIQVKPQTLDLKCWIEFYFPQSGFKYDRKELDLKNQVLSFLPFVFHFFRQWDKDLFM